MANFWQNVRGGVRWLAKNPGFAITTLISLALGIGACSAIFSVVYGVLVKDFPYPHAERVMMVYMHFHPQDMDRGTMSDADFLDWRARNRSFDPPGLFYEGAIFEITGRAEPELVTGAVVTAGFFSTLGQKPLIGRVVLPMDEKIGETNIVVLSEGLWRRLFNSNPDAIGQSIRMSGQTFTIVGVMPRSFRLPTEKDELWTNYQLNPAAKRDRWFSHAIARLKPGITVEAAQLEVNAIGRHIEQENPTLYSDLTIPLVPLRESIVGDVRPALLVMFGAVFFVLLIVVVNVASLFLGRAASRDREIAVRRSLGARPIQIVLQLFAENSLLVIVGGALGLGLAYGAIQFLRAWNPGGLPRLEDIHLDSTVLAFTCVVSLGAGIFISLIPAFQGTRADLNMALKGGNRAGSPSSTRHAHSILVVLEVALSAALLVGAGLLLRSFILLGRVDAGIHVPPQNVLTAKLWITQSRTIDPAARLAILDRLVDSVQALPGVNVVAISRTVPPDGGLVGQSPFTVEGQPWKPNDHPAFPYLPVSKDYFKSLAIPLLQGRWFTANDKVDTRKIAIVSDGFARRYFRDENPIGKRVKLGGPEYPNFEFMEIVGVVGDVKYFGLASEAAPAVYVPLPQDIPLNAFLVVRTELSAVNVERALNQVVQSMGRDVVIMHLGTLDELLADSVAVPRFRTTLLGTFAVAALVLAAVGVYGVVAYSVVQRTHEIGVRIALGGQQTDILRLILGQGLQLTIAGLLIGLGISISLASVLRGLLFQVKPADPMTLVSVAGVLGITSVMACYLPARRAASFDPMFAVRHE